MRGGETDLARVPLPRYDGMPRHRKPVHTGTRCTFVFVIPCVTSDRVPFARVQGAESGGTATTITISGSLRPGRYQQTEHRTDGGGNPQDRDENFVLDQIGLPHELMLLGWSLADLGCTLPTPRSPLSATGARRSGPSSMPERPRTCGMRRQPSSLKCRPGPARSAVTVACAALPRLRCRSGFVAGQAASDRHGGAGAEVHPLLSPDAEKQSPRPGLFPQVRPGSSWGTGRSLRR